MNKLTRLQYLTLGALSALVLVTVVAAAPAPNPPIYNGAVQRQEHVGINVDSHPGRCVRGSFAQSYDAGWPLSGEPDASGPDAAVWTAGADAAVWPAATVGPRVLPRSDLSYVCYCDSYKACLKQGGSPQNSCSYTFTLPADQLIYPVGFPPEPDGGQPMVWGYTPSGTSACECCPIIPDVKTGR